MYRFVGIKTAAYKKEVEAGDHIYIVGGAVGADGIHGATFSSLQLDEHSPATAVQIGDPITQKRVGDFLVDAQARGLFSCITDNGAGGISSSVGEMATMTNGAIIDLAKNPLKYPGLLPYEIMISESQERMTVAVPEENRFEFEELSKKYSVTSVNIGQYDRSGDLHRCPRRDRDRLDPGLTGRGDQGAVFSRGTEADVVVDRNLPDRLEHLDRAFRWDDR